MVVLLAVCALLAYCAYLYHNYLTAEYYAGLPTISTISIIDNRELINSGYISSSEIDCRLFSSNETIIWFFNMR